jgi:hypothetical protein
MSMSIEKFTNLDMAIKNDTLIAINVSDKQGSQNKGQLVFTVSTKSGAKIDIMLPPTWLPQDLTAYASMADFADCLELRALLRNNLIILISRKQFEQLQKSPDYEKEKHRVAQLQTKLSKALQDETTTFNLNVNSHPVEVKKADLVEELPSDVTVSGNTSIVSKVRNLVYESLLDFGSSHQSITDLINYIESIQPPLTHADYSAIISKTKDRTNPVYRIALEVISLEEGSSIDYQSLDYVLSSR